MAKNRRDQDILRELAVRVAEIASLPSQQRTVSLWKSLNALRPVRPMVLIDELPWQEMDTAGELALRTQDPVCRQLETTLRRTLYAWRHMPADMVVEPHIDVPKILRGDGFGIEKSEKRAIGDPRSDVYGHFYLDQISNEADLEKIWPGEISLDVGATARAETTAHEALDGILEVRMQGALPYFDAWDKIVEWHGAENTLVDLADRPVFMQRVIRRVTDAHLNRLDQLESRGLLGYGQATVHCSGAFTDELPAPGFDRDRPRAKDIWTYGMAQIFSSTSPAMHQAFELESAIRWYSRFGLGYYGCCEPLHSRMDMVRRIPNIRKVSMSAWVNVEQGAERIGRDYVFSYKPSPAIVAAEAWDPAAAEADLRPVVEACRRHGCPLEFILKDVSTVRGQPQRVWEWSELAMHLVGE